MCKRSYLAMKVASFVKECRPDPPYPTSIPWPLLNLMILFILQTYDIASSNKVMFIAAALKASLNSASLSYINLVSSFLCL
jgi:hypothetical protein